MCDRLTSGEEGGMQVGKGKRYNRAYVANAELTCFH